MGVNTSKKRLNLNQGGGHLAFKGLLGKVGQHKCSDPVRSFLFLQESTAT